MAAPELLRVTPKRRVPFSRRNNGEDVGKGLAQDVNHYKDGLLRLRTKSGTLVDAIGIR